MLIKMLPRILNACIVLPNLVNNFSTVIQIISQWKTGNKYTQQARS